MSGPFDAALSLLGGAAFAIRGHMKDRDKALKDCREIANACLVLEAAGKVDKETVSVVLGDVRTLLAREGRTAFIWAIKDALALLSALPDKDGEERKNG